MSRTSQDDDNSQNPDSSSEKLDVTEIEDESDIKDDKELVKDVKDHIKETDKDVKNCEGVNLSVKVRKAAVTLVKQKEEVSSSDRENNKCSKENSRHVWRPY